MDKSPRSKILLLPECSRNWLKAMGVVSAVVVPGVLVTGWISSFTGRRSPGKVDHTEAVSHARQVGVALLEFETEYGQFPDWSTIPMVRERRSGDFDLGTKTSNDYFRQLFAAGIVREEGVFHARTKGCEIRPDGVTTPGETLKKGECGFTYLPGAGSKGNPARPVMVTPMIPGTDRFDPEPFNGKAVILMSNGFVTSCKIDKHGYVIFEGRNLMDPGHPVWGDHSPSIAWPE